MATLGASRLVIVGHLGGCIRGDINAAYRLLKAERCAVDQAVNEALDEQ